MLPTRRYWLLLCSAVSYSERREENQWSWVWVLVDYLCVYLLNLYAWEQKSGIPIQDAAFDSAIDRASDIIRAVRPDYGRCGRDGLARRRSCAIPDRPDVPVGAADGGCQRLPVKGQCTALQPEP